MAEKYMVGLLKNPEPDDAIFDDFEAAVGAAIASSVDDDVWAVWVFGQGIPERIVYQGGVWQ